MLKIYRLEDETGEGKVKIPSTYCRGSILITQQSIGSAETIDLE